MQTRKTGEGRAPVRSGQLEPGAGDIAAAQQTTRQESGSGSADHSTRS